MGVHIWEKKPIGMETGPKPKSHVKHKTTCNAYCAGKCFVFCCCCVVVESIEFNQQINLVLPLLTPFNLKKNLKNKCRLDHGNGWLN